MIDFLFSYRVRDFLLFSKDTFLEILISYNRALWPAQIVALILSMAILILSWRSHHASARAAATIASLAWFFTGWRFHLAEFAAINWAAKYFAWLFFLEGSLLLALSGFFGRIGFRLKKDFSFFTGLTIFVLSAFFPLEALSGVDYRAITLFGWGAEMTAWGTLGILFMLKASRWSWILAVAPAVYVGVSMLLRFELR